VNRVKNISSSNSEGDDSLTILTIVFVVLKLTENIDWSWWWVFSPVWIAVGFAFFIVFIELMVDGGSNR